MNAGMIAAITGKTDATIAVTSARTVVTTGAVEVTTAMAKGMVATERQAALA